MDRDLMCDSCLNPYDQDIYCPMCIPCGHTICLYCLKQNWKKEDKVRCLIENKTFHLRPDQCAKNHYILKLLQTKKTMITNININKNINLVNNNNINLNSIREISNLSTEENKSNINTTNSMKNSVITNNYLKTSSNPKSSNIPKNKSINTTPVKATKNILNQKNSKNLNNLNISELSLKDDEEISTSRNKTVDNPEIRSTKSERFIKFEEEKLKICKSYRIQITPISKSSYASFKNNLKNQKTCPNCKLINKETDNLHNSSVISYSDISKTEKDIVEINNLNYYLNKNLTDDLNSKNDENRCLKNLDDIFRNNIEPQGIIIKNSNSNLNPFVRKTDNTLIDKTNNTNNKKENNCLFNLDNFIIEKDNQDDQIEKITNRIHESFQINPDDEAIDINDLDIIYLNANSYNSNAIFDTNPNLKTNINSDFETEKKCKSSKNKIFEDPDFPDIIKDKKHPSFIILHNTNNNLNEFHNLPDDEDDLRSKNYSFQRQDSNKVFSSKALINQSFNFNLIESKTVKDLKKFEEKVKNNDSSAILFGYFNILKNFLVKVNCFDASEIFPNLKIFSTDILFFINFAFKILFVILLISFNYFLFKYDFFLRFNMYLILINDTKAVIDSGDIKLIVANIKRWFAFITVVILDELIKFLYLPDLVLNIWTCLLTIYLLLIAGPEGGVQFIIVNIYKFLRKLNLFY